MLAGYMGRQWREVDWWHRTPKGKGQIFVFLLDNHPSDTSQTGIVYYWSGIIVWYAIFN